MGNQEIMEHLSRYEIGMDECSIDDQKHYPFALICKLHRHVYHFETLQDAEAMCTREALLNQEDLCYLLCDGVKAYGFKNPVSKIHDDSNWNYDFIN